MRILVQNENNDAFVINITKENKDKIFEQIRKGLIKIVCGQKNSLDKNEKMN